MRIMKIFVYILYFNAFLLISTSEAAIINVYCEIGQSNIIGPQNTRYIPAPADKVVRLYAELGRVSSQEYDMTIGEYPRSSDQNLPRFLQDIPWLPQDLAPIKFNGILRSGPEITFGRLMYRNGSGDNITIAKFAIAASSLESHWVNSGSVDFVDRAIIFLSYLKEKIEANGDVFVLKAVNIGQGESDATYKYRADNYLRNLKQIVNKLRNFAHNAKLPITVARTSIDLSFLSKEKRGKIAIPLATVRAAQEQFVNEDKCAVLIDQDDFLHRNAFHFEETEYDILGRRQFSGVINILKREQC